MWDRILSPSNKSQGVRNRGDDTSTLPPPAEDPAVRAQEIVQEVQARRAAGEVLPDEHVLSEYPHLADLLRPELDRLHPQGISESAPQPVAAGTCDNPKANATGALEALAGPPQDVMPARTLISPPASEVSQPIGDPGELSAKKALGSGEAVAQRDTVDEDRCSGEPHPRSVADFRETLVSAEDAAFTAESPYTPIYCPAVRPPMGVVRLYHDGEPTFTTYPVMGDRFVIGRREGDLVIPHDLWMSGRHVEIQRRRGQNGFRWFVVDLQSMNGTFLRNDVVVLEHKDELFIGRERYRFVSDSTATGLIHVTKGKAGAEWIFKNPTEKIGRDMPCGLPSFAADPYLEPLHAEISRGIDQTWTIRDNRSRNGIWHRIKEAELFADSMFQIGEQRFGFWCPTTI